MIKSLKKLLCLLLVLSLACALVLLGGCSKPTVASIVDDAESGDTIVFEEDMTNEDDIAIDKELVFDLNQKAITTTKPFVIKQGGKLTIKNGILMSNDNIECVIKNEGTLVVDGAVIKTNKNSLCIKNQKDFVLKNGTISGKNAVDNNGNFEVQNGKVYGDEFEYSIINTNKTTINGGIIGEEKLTVYNTTYHTAGIKSSGTLIVNNGTLGSCLIEGLNSKGYFFGGRTESIDCFDGYVEFENKTGNLVLAGSSPLNNFGTAVIKSGTFTSIYAEGYADNGAEVINHGNLTIYGGDICHFSAAGDTTIYGGTFADVKAYHNLTVYGGTFNDVFLAYNASSVDLYGGVFKQGAEVQLLEANPAQNTLVLQDLLAQGYVFDSDEPIDTTLNKTTLQFSIIAQN